MTTHTVGRSIVDRMRGAAMLDVHTYEEVEADESATGQAAVVVAIVAICAAIGGFGTGGRGVIGGLFGAVIGWLVWAGITYFIGDKLLGGTASWGELLRTLGFAQAPGVLLFFAFIPLLGWLLAGIVGVWLLITGVIAIRQALDFSTGRAIGTALLGWLVMVVVQGVFRMG
ncbi:MAG TPA: YIP1 family protein [Gemmatimonadaceae bacterium]|nr:YIP1 family protein [Gemmatimonadaceae bacterium]